MTDDLENAILRHIDESSPETLHVLYEALLRARFVVSLAGEMCLDPDGRTDVPLHYVVAPTGEHWLPAFTSVTRFLEWKSADSPYAELPAPSLFGMVKGMPEIDCIYVNYSDHKGTPKGKLTRPEFELLADGICPA